MYNVYKKYPHIAVGFCVDMAEIAVSCYLQGEDWWSSNGNYLHQLSLSLFLSLQMMILLSFTTSSNFDEKKRKEKKFYRIEIAK